MAGTLSILHWLYGDYWTLPDGPDTDGRYVAERTYGDRVTVRADSLRELWHEIFIHEPAETMSV